jgi:hypothetical protein
MNIHKFYNKKPWTRRQQIIREERHKEKEQKKVKQIVDSFVVTKKTIQSLVEKCAKANFNNVWFATIVREVGNKFHRNFVVGFKAHP